MPSQRLARVQNLLRSEISTILQRKLKDPRVHQATITRVEVAPDLRHARVYIGEHWNSAAGRETLVGLSSAAGFIRSELMKVLHLRPMPVLEFHIDKALARADHTLDLLDQIRYEETDNKTDVGTNGPTDPGKQ